jgi:hypothetical protein
LGIFNGYREILMNKYESEKYSFGDRLLNYLPSNPEVTPFSGVAYVEEVLQYLSLDFDGFLRSREKD